MAERTTLVCDVCGKSTKVERYIVGKAGSAAYDIDLCATDAKPLEPLIAKAQEIWKARPSKVQPTAEEKQRWSAMRVDV